MDSTRGFQYVMILEEIAYWFRKNCDALISLSFLCESIKAFKLEKRPLPQAIEIDSIGKLLNQKQTGLHFDVYEKHKPFLERLNIITNALKHSFIDSDVKFHGIEEPMISAIALNHNIFTKEPSHDAICMSTLVDEFNAFLETTKRCLESWPKS